MIRQTFNSAGCDAVCRVSGSRGEEETSVIDQQELNCARLEAYTASVVVVLLGGRIAECRRFEGNLETSGVSNHFIA
jgi:hypothetical protein